MNEIINVITNMNLEQAIQILISVTVILLFEILSRPLARFLLRLFKIKDGKRKSGIDVRSNPFYSPLKTLIRFLGIYVAFIMIKDVIMISPNAELIITKILKIFMILLVAKAFVSGFDDKHAIFKRIHNRTNKEMDETTRKMLFRAVRIGIYIIAFFMILSELGYDISGFITGLGISGVVITLAAQDTAKSIIGGIAIFIDKPYKVGDYIKVDEYQGTVEDIKFRSTIIRTIENTVLHIPNAEMASAAIINYSEMEKRRYYSKLVLELDTKLEKVEIVKQKIADMLSTRDDIIPNSIMINFQEISDNGMDLVVIAYINETNYATFLNIKEDINFQIMNILQKEKVLLAYNTQTIFVKK